MSDAVRQTVESVIAIYEGRIGTHSASCYQYHTACLAVLIRDLLDEESDDE